MAFGKLWQIAYRDLGRNRRRSFFTLLAVAVGLAVLTEALQTWVPGRHPLLRDVLIDLSGAAFGWMLRLLR